MGWQTLYPCADPPTIPPGGILGNPPGSSILSIRGSSPSHDLPPDKRSAPLAHLALLHISTPIARNHEDAIRATAWKSVPIAIYGRPCSRYGVRRSHPGWLAIPDNPAMLPIAHHLGLPAGRYLWGPPSLSAFVSRGWLPSPKNSP